ncbi:hypothetical protein FBU30_006336 [Linnemannia zychae]|nr:hypothetical protein FBU30_006336 [Linnemannia zychae]
MQHIELMSDSAQNYHTSPHPLQIYDNQSFHHDASLLSDTYTSPASMLQKQTLSSKRMRPPLSEISTVNIPPSSSTTLISSDALQQQQQIIYPHFQNSSSQAHNKYTTTTRINPNRGNNAEDEIKQRQQYQQQHHLHERARFAIASTEPPYLSLPASGLVTAVIGPHDNAMNATSPLSDTTILTPASVKSQPTPRTKVDKKQTTRANLSRDARTIKVRIRRLWMDPSQEEHIRARREPKSIQLIDI